MPDEPRTVTIDGQEVFDSRPEDIRAKLKADPSIIERELDARAKKWPSKDAVPNAGQERALLPYKQRHETYGDYPQGNAILGGNGAGKTWSLAIMLAGVTQGPEALHPTYFGQHQYFHECREVRKRRVFYIRIVCDGADVTESGSVYQQIRKWIPSATFSDKQGGYYTRVRIPPPSSEYKAVAIDIKTHKQDIVAHAGPDYDLILFNEPCPQEIWSENMARLRGNKNEPLLPRWIAFLTPLHMASYLYDVIHGQHEAGEIASTSISIWENCADEPGMRGILSRKAIETMIRRWKEINPLEVAARESGEFMFLAGAVFAIFNRRVHAIEPGPIEPGWNITQMLDPHPVKPHASIWVAEDAAGYVRVIAEYPTEPWDQITTTPLTLKQFGQDYRIIESGQHAQFAFGRRINVMYRRGDPNGMKAQHPKNRRTLQQEYEEECGLWYDTNIDNDVLLRHNAIRTMLFYNYQQPITAINCPKLYIMSWCHNIQTALERFRFKDLSKQGSGAGLSNKVEEIWEDWIDLLGYYLVSREPWHPNKPGQERDDYLEYLEGMDPNARADENYVDHEAILCRR